MKLTIVSPTDINECNYAPAESVTIHNETGILALRDALLKAYPTSEYPEKE